MGKENNLTDFLTDVADAIREKKGTTDKINPQDFSDEIKSINASTSMWTGHADVEGLKAIGWTDEDIAYYQEHGVNWMEEDDEYHKVSEDNKSLYGVLTASNISQYKGRITYLPKIDTSNVTSMSAMFYNLTSLVGIPKLDTSNVTNMNSMFIGCYSLVSVPLLDTSKVTSMNSMFNNCYSIVGIPLLDTSKVTSMYNMFSECYSIVGIPKLDTSRVTNMSYMFSNCYSLVSTSLLDTSSVTNMNSMFNRCNSLVCANIKNLKCSVNINTSLLLSKESLLYIINNESSSSSITITLSSHTYNNLSEDPDIVAALANHPLVSLASA